MSKEQKSKKLRKGLCGYRKKDVMAYMDEITNRYETALTEKSEEITRLKGQNQALVEENSELYKKVAGFESEREVISRAVISAEQRAAQILREADAASEKLVRQTKDDLEEKREEIRELKAQIRTLKLSSVATLRKYESQLEKLAAEDEDEDM